ncbi:MAG: T9SS type A sorting domain-containing protein [Bacteroidetes bacterium]|nr:T9SS type A sorting domain-containing protein [Bacteroidota bacterium]
MKKLSFIFSLTFISLIAIAQQVARDKVVVEIGTGTWCQFCPGAALGADDLIANGKQVAIIEYHNGDAYANAYSNYRNDVYYALTSYPTAHFDGVLEVVGGYQTQSMYSYYLPKYNQRIAIASSFTLDVQGVNSGLIDFDITVTVEKVASVSSTNMVLHMVLTQSDIAQNWQGLTELNYVERLMIPNQYGTALNFGSGNTQVVNKSFSLNPSWIPENCELVVFVQDVTSKEVLQGTKKNLMDFNAAYAYDASIIGLDNIGQENCTGKLSPIITIRNNANDPLLSLGLNYNVNNGPLSTYAWTGNLSYPQTEAITLPEISFDVQPNNTIQIYSDYPNGNPDQYPNNDTIGISFVSANAYMGPIYLNLRLDGKPEETTYEVINSSGDILYSKGPFPGQANHFLKDTFNLESDCFAFIIHDTGGDGICCGEGIGFYRLFDDYDILLRLGQEFGSMEITQFWTLIDAIRDGSVANELNIYPNPSHGSTALSFSLRKTETVKLAVYNLMGEMILENNPGSLPAGEHTTTINSDELQPGIYFIRLVIGEKVVTKKFSVIK